MANPKKTPQKTEWFIYVLQCKNGRLYTGITTDVQKRFKTHLAGKGAMFTRLNKPLKILAAKKCTDRSDASKCEWAMKQLTPTQKRNAIAAWPSILR